jgi:3-methyl-2-oxobutanoate hydroxymethyltransferase
MNIQDEIKGKKGKEKIVMLTAYDFQVAKILDESDIDMILVGDSLGMVVQGQTSTRNVTMAEMIYHTKAVARGAKNTPIIGDMPIDSYRTAKESLANARKLLEAGVQGVKIEGYIPQAIEALSNEGIPVMGHVGMLPQTAEAYRLKGKKPEEAEQILQDAMRLDRLNVFSMVVECVPENLAKQITESVKSPTIGIGAGRYCDGQVLVINDMLGLDESFKPKYVKTYADLSNTIENAVREFKREVKTGIYPDEEHTYH